MDELTPNERVSEENLIYVSTAEEYAFLHNMRLAEVLKLFQKNRIAETLRGQYDVLHTLAVRDSVSMVEGILKRAGK